MSFKEQLKKSLADKLQAGNTGLLESVDEFAKESGLTESEHTQVVSALAKYVDSANTGLVESILDEADAVVTEYANGLQESFQEKEKAITEAAEEYGEYLKTGASEYSEYLQEEYEGLAQEYIDTEVKPEIMESIDSYMAIMAAKLEEQGKSGINVLKAARFDQLAESLSGLGFTSSITESEEEMSEVERLQNELAEAQATIKDIGKQLKESQTKYRKAQTKDVLDELTEGLSDLQKDRVVKLASRLDETADDFEETVKDLVESVKTRQVNKVHPDALTEQKEAPSNAVDNMSRYAQYAKSVKTRLN